MQKFPLFFFSNFLVQDLKFEISKILKNFPGKTDSSRQNIVPQMLKNFSPGKIFPLLEVFYCLGIGEERGVFWKLKNKLAKFPIYIPAYIFLVTELLPPFAKSIRFN